MDQRSAKTLVVFDFDMSLVEEDTHEFVFKAFHPELAKKLMTRYEENPVWPQVCDAMLQEIADERPLVTREMIRKQLDQIPMQDKMADAVCMAVDEFGAEVKVISDGNTYFINSALEHLGLAQYVSEVFANPVKLETLDDGRAWLRIHPYYHAEKNKPLGCGFCPVNICKGSILASILKTHPYRRVIYVGDGDADFCPATRLSEYVLQMLHLFSPQDLTFSFC